MKKRGKNQTGGFFLGLSMLSNLLKGGGVVKKKKEEVEEEKIQKTNVKKTGFIE